MAAMAGVLKGFLSVCVVVVILASSWLIAVLLNYYGGQGRAREPHHNTFHPPYPGDKIGNLFWFVQVSDLHISKFKDQERVKDLSRFCKEYVDIIKPTVIIATGDLTDAKEANMLGSQQYLEEWQTYDRVLQETKVQTKTVWLDIRGNHDAFDVPSIQSKQNYFRYFSSSGQDSSRGLSSYQYIHKTAYGEYAFNALDMTLDPGTRRPFNFFGHVDKERLQEMNVIADSSKSANMSIWFGHYPFSTLTKPSLRSVMRSGSVYLCGHLHTLGEVVPKMHAVHPNGHLELELGDWQGTRNYRVAAIDHDLFSFTDMRIDTWPIILITNPKDAHFLMAAYEPIGRINMSTHIRMLLFSVDAIASVSITIDGSRLQSRVRHVEGPLYVAKWEPDLYISGVHVINVTVKDLQGRVNTRVQSFSLDGTRPRLDLLPAIFLLTDFSTLGRVAFYLTAAVVVFGLWFFRLVGNNYVIFPGCQRWVPGRLLTGLSKLCRTNSLFYPLFTYGVYIIVGPWFIGELVRGHVGCMFVFGVYTNDNWIPGTLTFYYGIVQLLSFNFALTLCLAAYLSYPQASLEEPPMSGNKVPPRHASQSCRPWCRCVIHICYALIILWQASSCRVIWRAYGTMAFLLSPVKLWSLPLAVCLWWKVI